MKTSSVIRQDMFGRTGRVLVVVTLPVTRPLPLRLALLPPSTMQLGIILEVCVPSFCR